MHHKYGVRDGAALWAGSTNWTSDSWSSQENVIVTVDSAPLALAYDAQLRGALAPAPPRRHGRFDTPVVAIGAARVRPWFCPGRGRELAHRIARADRPRRAAHPDRSPVLTSAPVLAALAEVLDERRVDATGVVDITQTRQALAQWTANDQVRWKAPVLERVLDGLRFAGKHSTPYAPDTPHDFMHAKISVVDDVVFVGSYNLSRSGEDNAENVLEIEDRGARRPRRGVDRRRCARATRRAPSSRPCSTGAEDAQPDDLARRRPRRAAGRARGPQHPLADDALAHPVQRDRPSARRPTSTTGKLLDLLGDDQVQRLEQLVERAEAAREHDEPDRVAHEHHLAGEEVLEGDRDVLVGVRRLLARQLDVQPDRQRPGVPRAAVAGLHDPGPAAGDDREARLAQAPGGLTRERHTRDGARARARSRRSSRRWRSR